MSIIFAKNQLIVIKNYPLYSHEYFMAKALELAIQAAEAGEIPVGAVIVAGGSKIIGKGSNQTEQLNDVTAHAEIIAITAATQYLGAKYLKECTLYVTLEPCIMCAGALHWSQIDRVIFGASDTKRGFSRVSPPVLHPKTNVVKGILETDCEMILKNFFNGLRT
jgi:tRNA(adenine34) deaminase